MKMPLNYQLRSITVRRTTSALAVGGVAVSVAVLLAVLALQAGLATVCETSGDPLNVIVLRKGTDSEMLSTLPRRVFDDLQYGPGVARSASGQPLASLELVSVMALPGNAAGEETNTLVRGIDVAVARAVRPALRLIEGTWFACGQREAVIGRSLLGRYPWARVGGPVPIGASQWTVVGVIEARASAINSELLVDRDTLASEIRRAELSSSVLLRATSEAVVPALIERLSNDRRLLVSAAREKDYYAAQTNSGLPVQMLGMLVTTIMALGSCFAVMNTMYTAVASRANEIGVLRTLGFSRRNILCSFLSESMLLAFAGSVLGCLLALPLVSLRTAIGSFITYSDIILSFRITPAVLMSGLVWGLVIGGLGGLLPANQASKKPVLAALRG
jgi:putative ABC transport system permease protein